MVDKFNIVFTSFDNVFTIFGYVRLGYRLGGRAPAARQARGPSAAAMTYINSGGYFP